MTQKIFKAFCDIVYEKSGISINGNKIALVTARVGKRMRELGMNDDREYLDFVLNDHTEEEIVHLLDVISTNVTSFFREEGHFSFLADAFSGWLKQGRRKFRFWSAASSSGEEPYSMAMTLFDKIGIPNIDVKILATDISTRVLAKCRKGVYMKEKLSGVPSHFLSRFFLKKQNREGLCEVTDELKRMVSFHRINLATTPFPMSGPFDAIFCRNVMIYFDNPVRQNLLQECYRLLKPDGYLFVGHAESLTGLLSGFKPIMPSVYGKGA